MNDTTSHRVSLKSLHAHRWDIPVLVFFSAALLIVGQSTPTMQVKELWGIKQQTFTIWTGIFELAQNNFYLLAGILFLFSVIFPYAKLFAILVLWFKRLAPKGRDKTAKIVGVLGKWSMLDVFVVAVFVVLTQASVFVKAAAAYGIYIFAAAIVLSIIVSVMVERLAQKEHEKHLVEQGKAQAQSEN